MPGRPAGRSPQRALFSRLSRHRAAAALLSAGLALRILVLAAYRPALFFTDSPRYLYDAQGNDPAGYRLPLRAILLAGNLQTVAVVQHLLGLAMAVTLYLLLTRHGAPRWLAAIATAPVLLDAYQLQLEQTIMPDVWFEALIVAGLAVLLWKPRLSTGACILAGLTLGSSATVRQVGEILIIPAIIFVLAAAGGGWRQLARKTIALTAAFAAPILLYCAASYDLTGHFWLAHTGVTTSYGRMAAAADCAALKLPPRERALCPTAAQRALGPDGLEHSAQSPLRAYYARLGGGASTVVSAFDAAVLRQQPGRVLAAAAADAVKLFAVSRRTRPGDTPISRWQFQPRYPASPPHATSTDIQKMVRQFGGGPPAVSRPAAQFLRAYQLDGGYTPGPLLLACAVAGLAGSLAAVRRRAGPAAQQLARGCLLFSAAAAAVLVISDAFEFSWRYQLPALVTLTPAAALALSLLRRGARPQQAEPGRRPAAGRAVKWTLRRAVPYGAGMALQPGTSQFGPDRGRVILRTTRAGLAGAAGHDLTIEIGQWAGTLTVLADQSPAGLEVRLEMGSLAVLAASGGLKPLSDKDKREIAGTTRKVLGVQRHPQATFSAEKFEPGPGGGVISGSLTLAGNTRPLALQVVSTGPDAYRATAAVRQTQFGIKPYSGLLGTLKVADVVNIEVDIDVSGLPAPRG